MKYATETTISLRNVSPYARALQAAKHVTMILLTLLFSGCVAFIPWQSYDGVQGSSIRSVPDAYRLRELAGTPDLASVDGRFWIYEHEAATQWEMIVFGMPANERYTTHEKTIVVSHQIDGNYHRINSKVLDCSHIENCLDLRQFEPTREASAKALQLVSAITQGDSIAAIELIEDGAPATAHDALDPVLHMAARLGLTDVLIALLDQGAGLEMRNPLTGRTPLHVSAAAGHDDAMAVLLARGATVDHKTPEDETALMFASQRGNVGGIKQLLAAGADPDHDALGGDSVLISAIRSGSRKSVELLIDSGARVVTRRTFFGKPSPLIVAVSQGDTELVQLLLSRGAKVNQTMPWGSPLHSAVAAGNERMVRLLLEAGANPRTKVRVRADTWTGWRRMSPIEVAQSTDQTEIVAVLQADR